MISSKHFYAAAALVMVALASCTLAPGKCHTMSDCDDGTTCVEGTCSGGAADPAPVVALTSQGDAGALPTSDASTVTPKAPVDAAVMDAGHDADASDAGVTDAATD